MIFDELVVTEKALKDLKKKTDLHKNKALQENTDTKYRVVLKQTESFISTLEYLYIDAKVQKNDYILNSVKELLESLENTISSGLALQDEVVNSENSYKTLQTDMKKEWTKKYSDITGATVSTLEAIKGIDPDNVGNCLQKIQPAESWDTNVKTYQTMWVGLDDADQLIASLGLDDGIIAFLRNANDGSATLKDLDDKVLAWIREEKLESRIRVSFVKK